jgi:hypothetical protein
VLVAPALRWRWPAVSARGVECDEAKLVRLMAMAVVAQGSPATYADGLVRGIAGGGVLRRPR